MRTFIKKLLVVTTMVMLPLMSVLADGAVTITYNLNGGQLSNGATTYQVQTNDSNAIIPDNPTKEGFIFAGWCKSTDYNNDGSCASQQCLVTENGSTHVRWTIPCADDTLTTDTTYIALWIEDIEVTCGAGQSAIFHIMQDFRSYSACGECEAGWICPESTTRKLSDISDFAYRPRSYKAPSGVLCSGELEYSKGGDTECRTCTNGLIANATHTMCYCGEGLIYDQDSYQCVSRNGGIHCKAGSLAQVYDYNAANGLYESFDCANCTAGFYCGDGNYSYTQPSDVLHSNESNWNFVGAQQCPDGMYSESDWGVTECTSCKGLPSDDDHLGCICSNGYIWNQDIHECVSRNGGIDCPAGQAARVTAYNSDTNLYESFTCSSCYMGYQCPGGGYSYTTSDEVVGYRYIGAERCDEYSYSKDWGTVSCTDCRTKENGVRSSNDREGCVCQDGYFWDSNNEICVSSESPSCPAGQYISGHQYDYVNCESEGVNCEEIITGIECRDCREGYYCDGSSENDGLKSCGENMYSLRGATDISDCKSCSSVANSTGVSDTNGCICNNGYEWQEYYGLCQPIWSGRFDMAPYGSNGGMVMFFDGFIHHSYTSSQNGSSQIDVLSPWLVFDDSIESEEDMVASLENGTAGMMLCRGHEILDENNNNVVGYAYTGPCTQTVRMCDGMEGFMSMFQGDVDVTLINWFMQKLHKNNYEGLFTVNRYLTEEGPNMDVIVFNTADCSGDSCATAYVSVLSAPMCLIDLENKTTPALTVKSADGVFYLNLTEETNASSPIPVTNGSEHVIRIIAGKNRTVYNVHDATVSE